MKSPKERESVNPKINEWFGEETWLSYAERILNEVVDITSQEYTTLDNTAKLQTINDMAIAYFQEKELITNIERMYESDMERKWRK